MDTCAGKEERSHFYNSVYTFGARTGVGARRMWFIQGLFHSNPPFLPFSGDLGAYEEAGLDLHLPL